MSHVAIHKIVTNEKIYKVAYVVNNKIKTMYVFIGKPPIKSNIKKLNLDNLFLQDSSNDVFASVFSPEEKADIIEYNTTVKFISERLHLDDTVEIIKKKILVHLMNELHCSFDELYLFMRQSEHFNATALYQNLTQHETLDLNKERLVQFLLNVPELDITTLEDKPIYSYSDLVSFNLDQASMLMTKPLGQKILSLKSSYSYPYTVNPFDAEIYDANLENTAEDITTTTNKNILMQYGDLVDNTLYLCLAEDVLVYAGENNLPENSTFKIYFPYLSKREILSLVQLKDQKQTLLGETRAMLSSTFEKNIGNVNLFYDIYANRTEDLNFSEVGIKSIVFKLLPTYSFNLPLDVVFKLIHATQDIPLIKLNLSKRRENIYRLYAAGVAVNGKKIPYLDKGTIFKWDKVMAKTTSVSVYIEHYEKNTNSIAPILCNFENNGTIVIKATFKASVDLDTINEIIIREVNPVITIVKEYLSQSGYNLNTFTDIKSDAIEIINIDYTLHIPIEKQIKIKSLVGCVSSMFNIINDGLEQGIMLRFKRVANYNETESQEALVLDMSNPYLGYTDADIIKALESNFNLKEEDARTKYAEVKRAEEVMQKANRKFKTRTNPGFLTTIVKQPFNNVIMITISGINHIDYLNILYIYMDSLIRMTQKPDSTRVTKSDIKNLCKGSKIEEETHVADIVAVGEQFGVEPIIAEELVFNKPQVMTQNLEQAEAEAIDEDDILARFGYEEEEEEGESGGAKEDKVENVTESSAEFSSSSTSSGVEGGIPLEADLTGLNLTNPNPFSKRMKKRDEQLFFSEGEKNFKSYSRACPWNVRRQPVILTQEEKDKIDKEHPDSYNQAVSYDSSGKNKFWYICPRYWSLKDNTSLRPDEVNPNEVIPKNAKKVPQGKHVFEFNDYGKEHLDENKKYITHYPGFLKPDKQGNCLPCCFKSWNSNEQTNRRAQCTKDAKIVVPTGRRKKQAEEELDEYILSHDKFPMTQENRYGYLPLAIQKFLHTDNKKCQISQLNTNIRENHVCLLRHSVEISKTQSFIACIADVWHGMIKNKEKTRPSIKRMKEIMIEAMSIDLFITLQNGNLIQQFLRLEDKVNNKEKKEKESGVEGLAPLAAEPLEESGVEGAEPLEESGVEGAEPLEVNPLTELEEYAEVFSKQTSKLYQIADKTNPEQMSTLIKVAKAYSNFIAYLRDDTVEINYSYLWDLICKSNPKLFPNGINMVILEIPQTDMTDNVDIICPSNHYSSSFFETKKNAIIILKINNFYEPIYAYESKKNEISITRYFNLMHKDTLPNIKYTLNLIKKSMQNKCGALASMPLIYKFEKNIPLEKVIYYLEMRNYSIVHHVVNYDSKVIGVVALNNNNQTKGFVPCYPSSAIHTAATTSNKNIWMDDVFSDTYEHTKSFLENVYNETKKNIPCKPVMKVIEDGLIVGLLTMTNQFVLISEPVQDTFADDLKIMQSENHIAADKIISTSLAVDMDRVTYIKKIKLETNFYNVFRNIAKYLLGQYQYKEIRYEIEEKSNSTQLYLKKLSSIEQLLRTLLTNHVVFHDYAEKDLLSLDTVTNCYGECKNKPFCRANSDVSTSTCALMIPATNLIHHKSNDVFYFGKLADEIVRYSRIKTFIFNPKNVLSFTGLKYNLRDNEIILLQSLLTQDYFQDLISAPRNPYMSHTTFETTKPITSQKYSNIELLDAAQEDKDQCEKIIKEAIANDYWRKIFPLHCKEIIYKSDPRPCSFTSILTLLKDFDVKHKDINKNTLKDILVEEYSRLYKKYDKLVLDVLKAQGKKLLANQIRERQLSMGDMIMSEDYYATNLDLWLLIVHYNAPVVLLTVNLLLENNAKYIIMNSTGSSDYYFLKISAITVEKPPIYTLITDATNNLRININKLRSPTMQAALRAASLGNTLEKFIAGFSLTMANKRRKRELITGKSLPDTLAPDPSAIVPIPNVPAPVSTVVAPVPAPLVTVPVPALVSAPAPAPVPLVKKLGKKLLIKKL